jgi:SMI1-KNR4 cell-wall
MSESVPVTLPEWREFLRSYSADYLRVATEAQLAELDEVQRGNRWLGYEPASEESVRVAEERLSVELPPSYRNFLLASNGWRKIDFLLDELLRVDDIGWLPEMNPGHLWDIWSADEEIAEQLQRTVLLSGPADGEYWLLDANTIGPDGEWTAYEWHPNDGDEPEPYPSFGALVASARETFGRLSGQQGSPVHPDGAENLLADGRRQALAGDVEAALASFDAAHAKGSALAPYLAALLTCFTAPGPMAESYIRNNVLNDRILASVDELHLRAELIPLYLDVWRDGATAHPGYFARWFADYLPPPDPAGEPGTMSEPDVLAARAARYIPPVLPEAPAFQQALDHARDLIAAGSNDEAWVVIQQALPEWEPDSPYRIAPVILRVDPAFRPVLTPDRYRTIVTRAIRRKD